MSKNLNDYSKEELVEIVKSLKRRKKFGLVWEDKTENVVKECESNLPVFEEMSSRAISKNENGPTNIIIEGDNYHSLSALNFTHSGKVDVIYIDPPYNTGNRDFIYEDNYVDRDDAFKHSKWLSFIEKRLKLARSLLKPSGAIFISIDHNELANLKLLCDELFTGMTLSGIVTVAKGTTTGQDGKRIGSSTDYLLVYAGPKFELQELELDEKDKKRFSSEDGNGRYSTLQWRKTGKGDKKEDRPNLFYKITAPDGSEILPIGPTGYESRWRGSRATFDELVAKDMIVWNKRKDGYAPYAKYYLEGRGKAPSTLWNDIDGNKKATIELKNIIGGGKFDNPKPTQLIQRCIQIATSAKNTLVLDFFAGSGTTGQAVLAMNKKDEGNRKFILCTNNENGIAEEVTYQRIKGVIEGYDKTSGIPANLRYFKTDLVNKQQTDDQTRIELVARSTDMICLREDTFEPIIENKNYKVFSGPEHYSAIVFEPDAINELKQKLEELENDEPVHIYVFSMSNDTYENDFADLERSHELRPIPESILEVYRRIFNDQNVSIGA